MIRMEKQTKQFTIFVFDQMFNIVARAFFILGENVKIVV